MKRICIYGKGGIGKSTTAANVAAALADQGLRTALIGCDPKADSTRCLTGRRISPIIQMSNEGVPEKALETGYKGILCIESGGPEPGTGCAGRGIASAIHAVNEHKLIDDRVFI